MIWTRTSSPCRRSSTGSSTSLHLQKWRFSGEPAPPLHHLHRRLLLGDQTKWRPATQLHAQLIASGIIAGAGAMSWNALLRQYSGGPFPEHAVLLCNQIPRCSLDTFSFAFVLKACANSYLPVAGSQFHALVIKLGFELHPHVHTSLLVMYGICGYLAHALQAFDEMPQRGTVTSNAMISVLARRGRPGAARSVFDRMPERNVVSWTAMIDAYTRARRPAEALALFRRMVSEGPPRPSVITVLAVVPAVSRGALDECGCLHAYCEKGGLAVSDVRVENSLVNMYAKCGAIDRSLAVFRRMSSSRRNSVSWTTVISGYAAQGMAREALEVFDEMLRLGGEGGVRPNRVTFLSVLSACGHGGMVEVGMRVFSGMVREHGVEPGAEHYGCVIDMLGRAGRLEEAEKLIDGMPMEVGAVVWRTLLGCCGKHGDAELAERVARRIMEKEARHGGDYVVLSNILNETGRFGDAEEVRKLLDSRSVAKSPGLSSVARSWR